MSLKPKVVLDTSVFISALLSSNVNSAPNQIIRRWQNRDFILIMTPQLLSEIAVVLLRKGVEQELIIELFESLDDLAFFQEGIYETDILNNIDKNDNMFLAACYEAKADYLVSLDKHLLNLKHFHQTLIFNPNSFLNQLSQG